MENPFGEKPARRVMAGVCTDCGVAAPHAEVHLGWHNEMDLRLSTRVGTSVSRPSPFNEGLGIDR